MKIKADPVSQREYDRARSRRASPDVAGEDDGRRQTPSGGLSDPVRIVTQRLNIYVEILRTLGERFESSEALNLSPTIRDMDVERMFRGDVSAGVPRRRRDRGRRRQ